MTSPKASASPPNLEALLFRFDQVWQQGTPPRIEEFLAVIPPAATQRRQLLEELVMIDLEYRWRLGELGIVAPAGLIREQPRLEDYVAHYAELGGLSQLSLELIGTEYRVRRRWGDRPAPAEYLSRFPRHAARLPEALRQIDTELSAELAGKGSPVPVPARPGKGESGAPVPGIASVAEFLEALRRGQLLTAAQLEELTRQLAPCFREPRALARELLQRGWLTPYQVNQLFLGRGAELMLGPYLILERLGEGGSGQVFKARHLRMNRLTALKVLRKELLTDAEVVQRFYREIRGLSQLKHPNVVHALDAGPAGNMHLLAMEYVEGTDLSRLVKQKGPLPIDQACDYIRQAALGLQHAHEHGMVHRDIKPHNLLLAAGQVKIVDLGLARLQRPFDSEATARLESESLGSLTPVGAVMMGTADYMAPEQALDFHKADIRADIYSLGATFHFLLTGQPPFPGGTLTQKLLSHQQAAPPPVQQTRPDVPAAVAAVVRRMLAKRPEDRHQTPAEVAQALAEQPASLDQRRRLRRRFILAGIYMGGLAGILGWALWKKPSRAERWGSYRWQHSAPVSQVIFSPNGQRVFSAGSDFTVRTWDLETGQPLGLLDLKEKLPGVSCLTFSPDGKTVAAGNRQDSIVKLWDLATVQEVATLQGHQVGGPIFIALSPESKTLASAMGTGGRSVKVTTVATRRYLSDAVSTTERILALAFSRDGKLLATAGEDKLIKLWDVASGGERLTLTGHEASVRTVAFAPDGKLLASGGVDQAIRLWEADTGKPWRILARRGGIVRVVLFSPNGQTLASADDQTIRIWDVATGQERQVWTEHEMPVLSLSFSPDGSVLVSGGEEGGVRLWEA